MLNAKTIKNAARRVGFDLCGIAPVRNFDAEREFFAKWLAGGFDSGLGYLSRNIEKRFSPALLMPGSRSVISCAVSYKNDTSPGYGDSRNPKVASYARTSDYHDTVRNMLAEMAEILTFDALAVSWRAFTDSAPILEKRWAVEAGLGFIGRNTLLVTPEYGSFVLLGELLIDAEADSYDEPYTGPGCGECRRCMDKCPNRALTPDGLDTSRCISRANTSRPPSDAALAEKIADMPLHGWLYGCDECQSVCPYNINAPLHRNPAFDPVYDPRSITSAEWRALTDEEFDRRFGHTPLGHSGLSAIKRSLEKL